MYKGNRRAADREWPPHITRIDGKPICIKKIRCASPDCDFEAEIIDRTRNGMAPDMVEKQFSRKGWDIGANEKHDFCPECVTKRRQERRAKRGPQAVQLKLVSPEPEGESMQQAVTAIDEPKQMAREDRRIIFAKLQECYIDETQGYQSPWTDKKVADDLGVPQAWVSALREENFGPAADNQQIRDLLERAEKYVREATDLVGEVKTVRSEISTLVERYNSLNTRAHDIGKNIVGLLSLADKIKASL